MRKSQLIFIGFILGISFWANASVLRPFDANKMSEEQLYEMSENGDAWAQYQLAQLYEKEKKADYPTIVLLLRRSAEQDFLEAQFALGHIYQFGKPNVQPDLLEAEKWYEKAAMKGDRQALQALEFLRNQPAYKMLSSPSIEDKWDVQWTAKTASYGDAQSQFELGRLYSEGKKIRMDYEQAAKWYEQAAVQGHLEAMYALAGLYLDGKGTKSDVTKALFWYEQAALRDYIPAERKLYEIYSRGIDRVPNIVKAAGWLYVSLAFLFPNEKDLTSVSPELKDLWDKMSQEEKEQVLYFVYSFIDEKRKNK